jgi:hypothetical protein
MHRIRALCTIACVLSLVAACASGGFQVDWDSWTDAPPDTGGDAAGDGCADSDGDTVCDEADVCPGGDDRVDTDGDTIPDACDCEGVVCGENASCVPTDDGPACRCDEGYEGDGFTCTDIDECARGTHTCDVNATCTNTPGSYTCTCNDGWTGDGFTCTDVDECTDGTHTCSVNATCTNTPGGYTCACNDGYTGDGYECTDVDECTLGTDLCDDNATCTNTSGGYDCTCNDGWTGDGFTCTDIDECALGTHLCDTNATCTNTPGSYECDCNDGYVGDGFTCTEIGSGSGHAVLIGHDYFASNADVDRIVGNAVALASTTGTISVLAYTEYSDNASSGEAANTDAAITSRLTTLGRTWTKTPLSSYSSLASSISSHHVLLVYEQERTTSTMLATIGTSWASTLSTFVAGGGVVIVCDFNGSSGGTWEIMRSGGLMGVTASASESSSASLTVVATSDPVALSLSNPYTAANGTLSFTTTETGIVSQTSAGRPVVIHKVFP